jgi:DNA-binding beta-propeller fold protein YncE
MRRLALTLLAALFCAAVLSGGAKAAPSDPLFVFVPKPPPLTPAPYGYLYGPCGLGVSADGSFHVSDYYHHAIDAYDESANYNSKDPPVTGATGYLGQLAGIDPLSGPCGLAFDAAGRLYVNSYHRSVIRYPGLFGSPTTIAGVGVDSTHPTGVAVDPTTGNVYVNARTHIAVYDSSGAPVMDGPEPLRIGQGSLEDGYGLAISQYPGTEGRLYVPDAATNTVKIYDPSLDNEDPVAAIDGAAVLGGQFVSLRDAAIAIDRVTGEIYVVDNTEPLYTEKPEAIVYVFGPTHTYEGQLKFKITDALPPGLAVDNTEGPTQGRVYVTSGNTDVAGIYAYPPGAATTAAPKASTFRLSLAATGTGGGVLESLPGGGACEGSCQQVLPAAATVSLVAEPEPGSAFVGWSGACAGTEPTCTVRMDAPATVQANFTELAGPPSPEELAPTAGTSAAGASSPPSRQAQPKRAKKRRRAKRRHHNHRRAQRAGQRGVRGTR